MDKLTISFFKELADYICCGLSRIECAIGRYNCFQPQNISVNCNVPDPVNISGEIEVSGSVDIGSLPDVNISSLPDVNIGSIPDINITTLPNITCVDDCTEAMVEILSKYTDVTELIFKNGEQFQKVTNITLNGYWFTAESQGVTIIAPVCNIEYITIK
jgi:hypothetical protein